MSRVHWCGSCSRHYLADQDECPTCSHGSGSLVPPVVRMGERVRSQLGGEWAQPRADGTTWVYDHTGRLAATTTDRLDVREAECDRGHHYLAASSPPCPVCEAMEHHQSERNGNGRDEQGRSPTARAFVVVLGVAAAIVLIGTVFALPDILGDSPKRATATPAEAAPPVSDDPALADLCDRIARDAGAVGSLGLEEWTRRMKQHSSNPAASRLTGLEPALQQIGRAAEQLDAVRPSPTAVEELMKLSGQAVERCNSAGLVSFIPEAPNTTYGLSSQSAQEALEVLSDFPEWFRDWNVALAFWSETLMDPDTTYDDVLDAQDRVLPELQAVTRTASRRIDGLAGEPRDALEPLSEFLKERLRRIEAVFTSFERVSSQAGFERALERYIDHVSYENMMATLRATFESPILEEALRAEGSSVEEMMRLMEDIFSGE